MDEKKVRPIRYIAFISAITGTIGRLILSATQNELLDVLFYFTVQSNLMVCLFLGIEVANQRKGKNRRPVFSGAVQGAVLLYILITGIVYNTMLASRFEAQGLSFIIVHINHSLTPLLFLLDWMLYQRKGEMKLKHLGLWLLYPIAYLLFGSIEGAVTGEFRYFFLDFKSHTPQAYALLILGVTAFFIFLGGGILLADRKWYDFQPASSELKNSTKGE